MDSARTPPTGWRWKEDGHNTIETEDGICYVGINDRGNVFVHAPKSAGAISKSIQGRGATVIHPPFVAAIAFVAGLVKP